MILLCFLRGLEKAHTHTHTPHTPQYFVAHKETAGALPLTAAVLVSEMRGTI